MEDDGKGSTTIVTTFTSSFVLPVMVIVVCSPTIRRVSITFGGAFS